jgi:hypothetical protein
MFNDLPCPALELQQNARILRLNPLAAELLQCEARSRTNQFFHDFLEKEYRSAFPDALNLMKNGHPIQYEAAITTTAGHAAPITLKLSRLSNNNLLALVFQENYIVTETPRSTAETQSW